MEKQIIILLPHVPSGPSTAHIGNTHGDTIPDNIRDFCGDKVCNALMDKLAIQKTGTVGFNRGGVDYHLFGGVSKEVTIPGKYCFNVFKHR